VRACAFLAPNAIPEEIFTQAGAEWDEPIVSNAKNPLAWVESIEEAGRFAPIRRVAEKTLDIHRLVQEVAKDEVSVQTRQEWAERAIRALDDVFS
jgi:hypothetical protein